MGSTMNTMNYLAGTKRQAEELRKKGSCLLRGINVPWEIKPGEPMILRMAREEFRVTVKTTRRGCRPNLVDITVTTIPTAVKK